MSSRRVSRIYVLGPYREPCLSVDEGEWLHVGALRQLTREGWRVEHVDAAEAYVQGGAAPRMEATKEKPGKSERQGLPESDAGKSVRQGLPKPDPSGIAVTTPPVSVTKPPGRAVGANEPGEIPVEIQTDGQEWHMCGGDERELVPIEAAEISCGREVAVRGNPVNGQRSASPHLSDREHVVCPVPRRRGAEEREPTRNPGGLREARFRSKQAPRSDGADRPEELGTSGPEVQAAQPVLNGLQPMDLEGWPVDAAEGIDCTVQMVEDMANEDEELIARVQGVAAGGGDMEMLLLNSGAYTHVCPETFAPEIPIVSAAPRVGGFTASGQGLAARSHRREGGERAGLGRRCHARQARGDERDETPVVGWRTPTPRLGRGVQ